LTIIDFLLFVMVGCGIGFLSGLFGVGGGILIVPVLVFSYEHTVISPTILTHMALGTSLFVVIFGSLMSAYQHNKHRHIDWHAVFVLGFSSALTALVTARLSEGLSGRFLRMTFALIVLIAGIQMLAENRIEVENKREASSKPHTLGLIGVGFTAGIVSALAGIGGGVFILPMMHNILKMPFKLAIGTSSATVVITALFSLVGYIWNGIGHTDLPPWSMGFVDLRYGTALATGSLLLARAGAYVSFKTHPYYLKKIFALFTILISIYMLAK